MKNISKLVLFSAISVLSFACGKDDDDNNNTPPVTEVVTLENTLSEDMTLTKDKKYLLKGFVYVPAGKTLTIEPGTIIKGDKDSKGTLIVERGGKLIADGTASDPIVFTSNMPAGQRSVGDWGGIILLGKAPVNLPGGTGAIEGGVDRMYGGTEPNDNSGVLRYVRLEFSGIAFQPDNEINGLTMGGVGAGTTLDYIQVSYNGDDSFEWFGGTVNAKHLVAYHNVDDMFDTDAGYSGTVQYALGISNPDVADVSKSNGFESDNDGAGSGNTPLTSPKFVNVSLYGPMATTGSTVNANYGRGLHIRRNSQLQLHNSVEAGWPTGLLLDSEGTQNGAMVKNTVIAGATDALKAASPATFDVANWFNTTMTGNQIMTNNADLQVPNAYATTGRSFAPATGSPLLSGGVAVAGAEANTFRGAIGQTDWTQGWTNWDPQNTPY